MIILPSIPWLLLLWFWVYIFLSGRVPYSFQLFFFILLVPLYVYNFIGLPQNAYSRFTGFFIKWVFTRFSLSVKEWVISKDNGQVACLSSTLNDPFRQTRKNKPLLMEKSIRQQHLLGCKSNSIYFFLRERQRGLAEHLKIQRNAFTSRVIFYWAFTSMMFFNDVFHFEILGPWWTPQ